MYPSDYPCREEKLMLKGIIDGLSPFLRYLCVPIKTKCVWNCPGNVPELCIVHPGTDFIHHSGQLGDTYERIDYLYNKQHCRMI